MRIAYWGNDRFAHCTEVHVAESLRSLGHEVVFLREGEVRAVDVPRRAEGCDLLVWTTTRALAEQGGSRDDRWRALLGLARAGVPTVAFHLDRWFGLAREREVREEPFFRCGLVVTADGGHDDAWAREDIVHRWLPPGVFHVELGPGTPQARWQSEVCFVGSWRNYGHPEWWPQRQAMLDAVRRRFPLRCFPEGNRAVRGRDLTDLYASSKVVIGDTCLAGGATFYASDRLTETLGRGGFLVHPRVKGITDGGVVAEGVHLACYDVGDHAELVRTVDFYLTHPEKRERIRAAGMAHVAAHHTYRHRAAQLLDLCRDAGLLPSVAAVGV